MLGMVGGFFCLPKVKFSTPYSTVLEDRKGHLLGATIARDGQWRFPLVDTIPGKFTTALLFFEDRYFYQHVGFNPVSFGRALYKNIKAGSVKQGGSTLTMQTVRLARNNPKRTLLEKLYEILLAMRLEISHSKEEIMAMYVSQAPYGGNVVGLEAAAWRYYARKPDQLSWGEAATLAVLPNSPSLIYPGKNQEKLLKKRNRLLRVLWKEKVIDQNTLELALLEPLPQAPQPLPRHAPHLLNRAIQDSREGTKVKTTLDLQTQVTTQALLEHYHHKLESNSIHNGAILIIEIETGKVLAYVGNTKGNDLNQGHEVDIINSQRSYGSLLKPFLYAASMEEGQLLKQQLLNDLPTNFAGYKPQNFFKEYDGVVPANEALCRSLNVPFVRMLHDYGTQKFYDILLKSGIRSLNMPPNYYGLSIILGGAESTLWELTGAYASLTRSILTEKSSFGSPVYAKDSVYKRYPAQPTLSPTSLYLSLEAIAESKRPGNEGQWLDFASNQKIYWKTGTSYGSRDAWSIGVTGKYAVGVWLGNSSGEGRPGLTGIGVAAPLMFDVFKELPTSKPLRLPSIGSVSITVCNQSGYKASNLCPEKVDQWASANGSKTPLCPYHVLIHLEKTGTYRVNSSCEKVTDMQHKTWFLLPTLQEWYYKPKHPQYKVLPSWRSDCEKSIFRKELEIIYPKRNAKLYIPLEINNKLGKVVFEAAHTKPRAVLYWHVDNQFMGETKEFHNLSLQLPAGAHLLTVMDAEGQSQQVKFEVLAKTE